MKILKCISFIILIYSQNIVAQIDAESLMGLPTATTTEMNAITPQLGNILYNTTDDKIYKYTSTGWQSHETDTYIGHFIIEGPGGTTASNIVIPINSLPFTPTQIKFEANTNNENFGLNDPGSAGLNSATLQNAFGTSNGYARDDSGTIAQAVIYIGGSGTSINSISRYTSSSNCIGLRFSDQNGNNMGVISGTLSSFSANGFNLNISYTLGTSGNVDRDNDILDEDVIVIYTAHK